MSISHFDINKGNILTSVRRKELNFYRKVKGNLMLFICPERAVSTAQGQRPVN